MSEFAQNLLRDIAPSGDDSWLSGVRAQGREQFERHGLPDKRIEEWKYTSLLALEKRTSVLGTTDAANRATYKPAPLADAGNQISMIDGEFSEMSGEAVKGVRVQSLSAGLAESPEWIHAMLGSLDISQPSQSFSALNSATLGPGVVIQVPAHVDAGEILLQWNNGESTEDSLFNSRVLLVLEEGAKLHLLEQFENRSEDSSTFNLVTQSTLGEAAELVHTRLQQQSSSSSLITRIEVSQASNSQFKFTSLDLGTGLARHDVKAKLLGDGASCELNGACVGSEQSHTDHHLYADHIAENCQSSQLFRAVAMDRSRIVFNGKVHVFKGADGTEAKQSSAGLLLSKLAEIDAKPELEIYADEVIANHGATVGQLDDKALFYLQTRGLNKIQATNLLTMAFCRSVTDQLPSIALREALGERLSGALQGVVENV
jgi:Fe-S cluster assembly protein SufD